MRKARSGHIVITGTGRSGTTLLVQFFTALGFDTGYTEEESVLQIDMRSKSGLEAWLAKGQPPHVVKSPWIIDEIDQIIVSGKPAVELFIIPMRDLNAAAESRRRVYSEALAHGDDPLSWPGTIWKTVDPAQQETALAHAFYGLVHRLVDHSMPYALLAFPRFAEDPAYLYNSLSGLFQAYDISPNEVSEAIRSVYRPEFVHDFTQGVPQTTPSTGQGATLRPDPARMIADVLGPDWIAETPWTHGDLNLAAIESPFYEVWKNIPGGHKKYAYFQIYDKVFGPWRGRAPKVLEIGVYLGASLTAWKRFFGPAAKIVGIDIDERCLVHDRPDEGVHVRIGHQADISFLNRILEEFGPFDIIMDDGSHMTRDQIGSFAHLFREGLTPGGIYFIEDMNTSFWSSYRSGPHDAYDLLTACMLGMNHIYTRHDYKDYVQTVHPGTFDAIAINTLISQIQIFDSACSIEKADSNFHPPLVIHN